MFYFTLKNSGIEIDIKTKNFDATNSEKFKIILDEYSIGRDLAFAYINMHEVEFIDNAGVSALLSVHRHLKEGAEPIKLLDPQPAVMHIIELLKLTSMFHWGSRQKM